MEIMPKLNNTRNIRAEDFDDEYSQLISQLGSILNSFMQEVVELSDSRIDFDNRVETIKTIDVTVDSSGIPTQTPFNVNVGKTGVKGIQVIRAYNLTNSSIYPTSQPFVNFSPIGGDLIKIHSITGLPANNKFQITLVIY
jgi:hypothetical protein